VLHLLILLPLFAALFILIGAPARKTALGTAAAMFSSRSSRSCLR
jgi:hypothetical protein